MGILVAIVGRPNVGKSTLFNRLSRSRSAIVDNEPGVTRDRNYAQVNIDGRTFSIVDTGGFEPLSEDPILSRMREQAMVAVEEADLVVFMADGREGVTPADIEVFNLLRRSEKGALVAVNKIDGPEHEDLAHDFYSLGVDRIYPLSAAHGYGIQDLLDTIAQHLPEEEAPGGPEERPVRIATIGRPNVGKSSLINRVLGEQRLVVSDAPGTTRDTIDTEVTFKGRSYIFTDTAGIRRKSKVDARLEKYMIIRALKGIEHCDVAILLMDASEGITDQDVKIAGYAHERGRAIALALNKWDLVPPEEKKKNTFTDDIARKMKYLSYAPIVNISALTGKGIDKLFSAVNNIHKQYTTRISTPALNKVLMESVEKHTPPRVRNLPVKLKYITQTGEAPPTFVVFCNRPEAIHFSYHRYLVNQIRDAFKLDSTPLKLIIKQTEQREFKPKKRR